ncbi:MAG: methionyl-tRNA formyltransferase [Deltaproteobacteria bacterium]|nr:methionyl-tRNA formyltransferase [Deltaproteobacteria bacterium]
MTICFFGSSSFSVPSLYALRDKITLVVTKKAKPKGRGYTVDDNEVKKTALSLGLIVLEIDSFKDEEANKIEMYEFDLIVTVSFGLIIPEKILKMPKLAPINVHPSLLPKYRGPSPIQATILNGDKETGITIIKMVKKMDAGNILFQEKVEIRDDDDAISLGERLSRRAAEILKDFVDVIEKEGIKEGIVQDERLATYTKMVTKEEAKIDWTKSSYEIVNMVRAYAGWPVAYTYLDGKLLKIHKARVYNLTTSENPGKIVLVTRDGILCATGDGVVLINEVQLENRRKMSAYDFANGVKGIVGKTLT